MPIIPPPEPFPDVDYLVCEGTYGNRLHDELGDAEEQLAAVINDTARRGGKVIIPSFAVGRTQELIFFLHLLRDAGKIPELDIYIDSPMAVNATAIFKIHQECYGEDVRKAFIDHHENPFGFEKLHYYSDAEQSKSLNDKPEPCIIIAGSGMCEGGRILHHLKNYVGDPKHTILVVGFMAANTLGRAIADRRPTVKIFGDEYPLRARVKILNVFSGHADYRDLLGFIGRMDHKRLRGLYLVHGENGALENLRTLLLEKGVRKVEIVEPGHRYQLG
jgi:metallo-beta-lactamase family protein